VETTKDAKGPEWYASSWRACLALHLVRWTERMATTAKNAKGTPHKHIECQLHAALRSSWTGDTPQAHGVSGMGLGPGQVVEDHWDCSPVAGGGAYEEDGGSSRYRRSGDDSDQKERNGASKSVQQRAPIARVGTRRASTSSRER